MKPFINEDFAISEITEIELLGVKHIEKNDLKIRKDLVSGCIIYPFTSEIKNIAIELKQKIYFENSGCINCWHFNLF